MTILRNLWGYKWAWFYLMCGAYAQYVLYQYTVVADVNSIPLRVASALLFFNAGTEIIEIKTKKQINAIKLGKGLGNG